MRGLSLVLEIRDYTLWWLLLLQSIGSREHTQQLWLTGLVDPWHVEYSWIRELACHYRMEKIRKYSLALVQEMFQLYVSE